MKGKWLRRGIMLVIAAVVAGMIVYAFLPKPVPVDMVEVSRGPLRVTVNEDGKTRIRERYTISAPLSGRLLRINLDPGDNAQAGQLLARIEPRDPELLDARARAESQARVDAAGAAVEEAKTHANRAEATLELASKEAREKVKLFAEKAASEKERDDALLVEQVRTQELSAARFAMQIAEYQLTLAEAALVYTADAEAQPSPIGRLEIKAPCNGRVLRVLEESEGFVAPGTVLLEFGDPNDLEMVVDVLSTDAVKIEPGDAVVVEHWGGEHALSGRVRVVEPSAFTKVSSLGVEEQRVNVIIDFVDPLEERDGLGDGYRVEAAIVVDEGKDILQVPVSALFRRGQSWAVFQVRDGRVVETKVTIGMRNGRVAEVIDGLKPGDLVVVHPSDAVGDGVAVVRRE